MKRNYNFSVVFSIFLMLISGCGKNTVYKEQQKDPELFLATMKELTDVIVHDMFSPLVASRVFVYPSIADYEAMRLGHPDNYRALVGQMIGLDTTPPPSNNDIDYHLASVLAFLLVGKNLIFSGDKIEAYQIALYKKLRNNGLPPRKSDNFFTGIGRSGDKSALWRHSL